MDILLNGETCELPEASTVAALVERLGLAGRRLAIEVDGRIVPRSAHPTTPLHPGARVEIVHAIGGG